MSGGVLDLRPHASLWWPRKEMPMFFAMRAEERAKIRAEFERR